MSVQVFLAGLAAEAGLLRLVLGEEAGAQGFASGLALARATEGPWSVPIRGAERIAGVILTLEAKPFARLDFLLRGLGLWPESVSSSEGDTLVYLGQGTPATDADLAPRDREVVLTVVADILALEGLQTAEKIAARLFVLMVRAASRLRARAAPPATLRHPTAPGDFRVAAFRQPYAHYFAVEEYDVSWRRFDGSDSETVTRAAFLSGDAVTVLPYDPLRDRVLVVEQFRAGPLARGDRELWQIEAIAGRIDPFETPEEAARREAKEEAGLSLDELLPVSRFYPSPGAVGEYIYSFVALTDLPDGCAGVYGVPGEAEDIRGHLISFAELMDLVASGEIENAPLILTALWLQRERGR